jgi:propionate kinase
MGMTPLEGLVMGTRCGTSILARWRGLPANRAVFEDLERVVNKESGLLGISGMSSDLRALEKAWHNGISAQLAIKPLFIALRGISPATRRRCIVWMAWSLPADWRKLNHPRLVAEHLKVFGIILDDAKNRCRAVRVSA